MAIFLNTSKINYWVNRLIKESKDELLLIVPYIKTSKNVFSSLEEADQRGVEITIVYREDQLSQPEKQKISKLNNLNLLHHPNIHCKCYFNGDMIILCSMNLYEYSEKNNREMGVLFHFEDVTDESGQTHRSDYNSKLLNDSIHEINEIINGASLERLAKNWNKETFEISIIETQEEMAYKSCDELNLYFLNKRFKPLEIDRDNWMPVCKNYFDKVDVYFESRRVAMKINLPEDELKKLFSNWMTSYDEFEFRGFKYYWNYHLSKIYLYQDGQFDWDSITSDKIYYKKIKQGIDLIIKKYRTIRKN